MPLLSGVIPTCYLSFQCFGHDAKRDFLAAQSASGGREIMSTELRKLVSEVYDEVKGHLSRNSTDFWSQHSSPPSISWFLSSTWNPLTFGLLDTKTGVLIGIPYFYNYNDPKDIQPSAFALVRTRLFGNSRAPAAKDSELEQNANPGWKVSNIDKNSEAGQEYANSLILSDKAKRFSVARELFYSDSYRVYVKMILISSCFVLSLTLSRFVVSRMGLLDAHLSQRLPFYTLFGATGAIAYQATSTSQENYYISLADKRAVGLGDAYREGAFEYYTKTLQRNKALRDLFDDFKDLFDESGELILPMVASLFAKPLKERLSELETS